MFLCHAPRWFSIMNLTQSYAYNAAWRGVTVGAAFAVGLSVLIAAKAKGTTGLVFVGMILASAMFVALALTIVLRRLLLPRVLQLAEDAILFPHGFLRKRITHIRWTDIIRMSESGTGHQVGLSLITARGRFEVVSSWLPDKESYAAVREFICTRVAVVLPRHDEQESSACRTWAEFPEPVLEWVEPEAWPRYRTHLVVSKPLLPRLAKALWFFVRCFGIFLLPWFVLRLLQLSDSSTAEYLWLIIPVSLFFTSLYWGNATHPARATKVTFRDNGITQLSGKQTWDLSYHDISAWTVIDRPFEGHLLHILLWQQSNHVTAVALPNINAQERLVHLLTTKGIQPSPDLAPPWESAKYLHGRV